ncbi:MAG: hypothetical protein FWG81_00175 [Betaproteobacteria bacterium]|nr:hypothetical protein [Betaproteobacteria bacterium]
MIKDYEMFMAQLEQLENTYKAMTEVRGMGSVMNDPGYHHYLPEERRGV